jgi:hypothetical protein
MARGLYGSVEPIKDTFATKIRPYYFNYTFGDCEQATGAGSPLRMRETEATEPFR